MYTNFCSFLVLLRSYLFIGAPCPQTLRRRSTGEGRPDTVSRRGSGVIRAACRAWRVLRRFLLGGSPRDDFPGFLLEAFFGTRYPPSFGMLVSLGIRISLKTARLASTQGSLCRDRFGVHYHPSLGVLRAVCCV